MHFSRIKYTRYRFIWESFNSVDKSNCTFLLKKVEAFVLDLSNITLETNLLFVYRHFIFVQIYIYCIDSQWFTKRYWNSPFKKYIYISEIYFLKMFEMEKNWFFELDSLAAWKFEVILLLSKSFNMHHIFVTISRKYIYSKFQTKNSNISKQDYKLFISTLFFENICIQLFLIILNKVSDCVRNFVRDLYFEISFGNSA